MQDEFGANYARDMQVVQAMEVVAGTTFELILTDTYFTGRYAYVMANGTAEYASATNADKNQGCFLCEEDGTMLADGSPGYKIF
jgi:hypothetical protein